MERLSSMAMNPNLNPENQNWLLKNKCAKHLQDILKIKNPDFSNSCSKCIREVFLRRDPDQLKRELGRDIEGLKAQVARLREEFLIKQNIKEEFCAFTTVKIRLFMREMDDKYEQIKHRIEEKL